MTNAIELAQERISAAIKIAGEISSWRPSKDLSKEIIQLLRQAGEFSRAAAQEALQAAEESYGTIRKLHACEHSLSTTQSAAAAAGDEIRSLHKKYGKDRQDCISAEKLSDELSDKLRDAQAVIGQQAQTIIGQQLAIAELMARSKED